MSRTHPNLSRSFLLTFLAATALTACGGGGGSSDISPSPTPAPAPVPSPAPAPAPAPVNVVLDFSLQGLKAGQVVTISAVTYFGSSTTTSRIESQATYNKNIPLGSLVMSRAVGTTYVYTIVTQPTAQVCSINKPTGTLSADTQIIVSCV